MNFDVCKHCGCYRDFCGNLQDRDNCKFLKSVAYHRSRAKNAISRLGGFKREPATLTVKEWIETLHDFGWRCAYCREQKPLELEHFIPLGFGVGTVKHNCVPACHKCNTTKGEYHPYEVMNTWKVQRKKIPEKDILRVREYLISVLSKS